MSVLKKGLLLYGHWYSYYETQIICQFFTKSHSQGLDVQLNSVLLLTCRLLEEDWMEGGAALVSCNMELPQHCKIPPKQQETTNKQK